MKPLFEKIARFINKEWFLLIMITSIALLILLFEVLTK